MDLWVKANPGGVVRIMLSRFVLSGVNRLYLRLAEPPSPHTPVWTAAVTGYRVSSVPLVGSTGVKGCDNQWNEKLR
jgi:hypothetical protein